MNALTWDQAQELLLLLGERDGEGVTSLLQANDTDPVYILTFIAGCCAIFATQLMNPHKHEGMFVLEQPGAAFGTATAPIWMQLVNATANQDEATEVALVHVITESDALFKESILRLFSMVSDLMHLLLEQGTEADEAAL